LPLLHHPTYLPIGTLSHNRKGIKLFGIPVHILILDCNIQIKHSHPHHIFQIIISHYHKVNSIQMRWFPLNVPLVGSPQNILFLLVVEDESVVSMGQAFYVLVEQELYCVVFLER